MHSVQRSPEPRFFAEIRANKARWDDLEGFNRRDIRNALTQDFGQICAYCEQLCQLPTEAERANEESIDHFRPRSLFPDQWFDWLNLIYACRRCNQRKGDNWPGYSDALTNSLLIAEDSRYMPVSEYVNPNVSDNQKSASEFFDFNINNGEIAPAERLDSVEWSIARRTISDIDLNDTKLGDYDQSNLCNQRKDQLDLMFEELESASGDPVATNQIISGFVSPHSPFSSYISAYVNSLPFSP